MKLVIGIGNPGEKYKNNRHNVGHFVVDELKNLGTKKLKNITVVKTNTYMNESGIFVKKLVNQYKINLSNLWVIHDDLDIPLGSYKIQFGKGPKLHNGVNSIEKELGSEDFWRVRVGIENRMINDKWPMLNGKKISGEEYVLQDFTEEERSILDATIRKLLIDLIALISIPKIV